MKFFTKTTLMVLFLTLSMTVSKAAFSCILGTALVPIKENDSKGTTSIKTKMHSSQSFYGIGQNPLNVAAGEVLTKQQFDETIDKVVKLYKDDIEAQFKIPLVVKKLWERSGKIQDINAYVTIISASSSGSRGWGGASGYSNPKQGDKFEMNIFGGLATHPLSTLDELALVVCHETGHLYGGYPYAHFGSTQTVFTVEGQSDYFATSKCLKKLFENEDNEAYLVGKIIPPTAQKSCFDQWGPSKDHAACVRIAMAGDTIAQMFYDITLKMGKNPWMSSQTTKEKPDLAKKDPSVVTSTYERHPDLQCRIDTYFQGALCTISHEELLARDNSGKGSCKNGTVGERPLCWFKPN